MSVKYVLVAFILLNKLLMAADPIEIGIINRFCGASPLSTPDARILVNELWSRSFTSGAAATPIQKLTSGFEKLINNLQSQQRSVAEQAYLLWLSGRTHGFSKNNNTNDEKAQGRLRDFVSLNVASRLRNKQETTTERNINAMLKESENFHKSNQENQIFTSRQDDLLLDSVASSLGALWLGEYGISDPSFINSLKKTTKITNRSLAGAFQAHQEAQKKCLQGNFDAHPSIADQGEEKKLNQLIALRTKELNELVYQAKKTQQDLISTEQALKKRIKDINDQIEEKENEIKTAKKDADTWKKLSDNLKIETGALAIERKDLESRITTLNNEKNKFKRDIAQLTADLAALQTQIANAQTVRPSTVRQTGGQQPDLLQTLKDPSVIRAALESSLKDGVKILWAKHPLLASWLCHQSQDSNLCGFPSPIGFLDELNKGYLNRLTLAQVVRSKPEWAKFLGFASTAPSSSATSEDPKERRNRECKALPPIGQYTGTDAFMRLMLGDTFYINPSMARTVQAGHHHSIPPAQSADIANIIRFLNQYHYYSPALNEFQTAANQPPKDWSHYVRGILQCLQTEREYPGCYFAYHTLSEQSAFISMVVTIVKEFMQAQAYGAEASRGCDTLCGSAQNVEDLLRIWGWNPQRDMTTVNNYDSKIPRDLGGRLLTQQNESFSNVLLSVNPFLFGSTNVAGSCTYDMWASNMSLTAINIISELQKFFKGMGLSLFNTGKIQELYDRFTAIKGTTQLNHLWQIRMTPNVVNKVMYLAQSGGAGISPDINQCRPTMLDSFRSNNPSGYFRNHPASTLQGRIGLIPSIVEGEEYTIFKFSKFDEKDQRIIDFMRDLASTVKLEILGIICPNSAQ